MDNGASLKLNLPQKSQQLAVTVTPDLMAQHLSCVKEAGHMKILQCGFALTHKDAKTHLFCLLNEAFNPACSLYGKQRSSEHNSIQETWSERTEYTKALEKNGPYLDAQNISNQSTLFLQSPSFGKTLVHSDKHLLEALLGLKYWKTSGCTYLFSLHDLNEGIDVYIKEIRIGCWILAAWDQILSLLLINWVTLDKLSKNLLF